MAKVDNYRIYILKKITIQQEEYIYGKLNKIILLKKKRDSVGQIFFKAWHRVVAQQVPFPLHNLCPKQSFS